MNILSFLKSLLPSFEKNKLLNELDYVKNELDASVIPAYEASVAILKPKNIQSKELKDLEKVFRRINPNFNREWFAGLTESFGSIADNLDLIRDIIQKKFSDEIAVNGLTYAKANLIRYVTIASFVSKYSLKFLRYAYILETKECDNVSLNIQDSLTKYEINWITDNFTNFAQSINSICKSEREVSNGFNNIPDIVITDENTDILEKTQAKKLDPLGMNFIAVNSFNPIYLVANIYNQFMINRYKAQKEELKAIELRKLYLEKLLSSGEPDAAIEKELNYLESRISDLNYKLNKFEESVE